MFIRIFTILYCLITIHFTFCMEPKKKRNKRLTKIISKSYIRSGRSFSLDRESDQKRNSQSSSYSKLSFSDESKEINKNITLTNENCKIDENGNTSLMRATLKGNRK